MLDKLIVASMAINHNHYAKKKPQYIEIIIQPALAHLKRDRSISRIIEI